MLIFEERGNPEYPEKNLSVWSREPTNSTHIWRRVWASNPGHIGGRRVLSPLRHPSSPFSLPPNVQHWYRKGGVRKTLRRAEIITVITANSAVTTGNPETIQSWTGFESSASPIRLSSQLGARHFESSQYTHRGSRYVRENISERHIWTSEWSRLRKSSW